MIAITLNSLTAASDQYQALSEELADQLITYLLAVWATNKGE